MTRSDDDRLHAIPDPAPPPGSKQQSGDGWYAAIAGQREGPMSLADLKNRLAAEGQAGETLVWKDGMREWTPAAEVLELAEPAPSGSSKPPPLPQRGTAGLKDILQKLDEFFSGPQVFRAIGRAAGAIAVVICALSVLLVFFDRSWFTGAVLFAVVFFAGEAAGAVLAALGKKPSKPVTESDERRDR